MTNNKRSFMYKPKGYKIDYLLHCLNNAKKKKKKGMKLVDIFVILAIKVDFFRI